MSHVQAAALELERVLHGDVVGASDISRLLGGMVEKLQVLKRKVCMYNLAGYMNKVQATGHWQLLWTFKEMSGMYILLWVCHYI